MKKLIVVLCFIATFTVAFVALNNRPKVPNESAVIVRNDQSAIISRSGVGVSTEAKSIEERVSEITTNEPDNINSSKRTLQDLHNTGPRPTDPVELLIEYSNDIKNKIKEDFREVGLDFELMKEYRLRSDEEISYGFREGDIYAMEEWANRQRAYPDQVFHIRREAIALGNTSSAQNLHRDLTRALTDYEKGKIDLKKLAAYMGWDDHNVIGDEASTLEKYKKAMFSIPLSVALNGKLHREYILETFVPIGGSQYEDYFIDNINGFSTNADKHKFSFNSFREKRGLVPLEGDTSLMDVNELNSIIRELKERRKYIDKPNE